MLRTQLKNYIEYLQKLELYMEVLNIKLEYKEYPEDGCFLPQARKIILDPDLTETNTLGTLLHELGHVLDDSVLAGNPISEKITAIYKKIYKEEVTEAQLGVVIACEKRAWGYGRAIARQLKIPLGKWYNIIENEAIKDYKKV